MRRILKYSLFAIRHPKLIKILWNLRLIKFGQFTTPSGEPYIGFKFTIGGGGSIRPLEDNDQMIQQVIEKWREEYFKEKGLI